MMKSWILAVALAAPALPSGYDAAHWGIGVAELQKLAQVVKADPGKGYAFAEHTEINPEVYVTPARTADAGKRVEYYFHAGKLYKVFVVYSRSKTSAKFYDRLITDLRKRYGAPAQHYTQPYFGFEVQHNLWEDADSILDVRMGAGFIYEVRVSKALVQKKEQAKDLQDAI